MQYIERQIQLLSTLRLVFAIAAVVFLVTAVFLFIYLKIPQVFNEYRGKSAKKEMEQMAAGNTESRRMRNANKRRHYTDSLSDELSQELEKSGENAQFRQKEQVTAKPEPVEQSSPDENATAETDVLEQNTYPAGTEETDVLNQNEYTDGTAETEVLEEGILETELLENGQLETEVLDAGEAETEDLHINSAQETEVLSEELLKKTVQPEEGTMVLSAAMLKDIQDKFEVEQSIILLHTDKVI